MRKILILIISFWVLSCKQQPPKEISSDSLIKEKSGQQDLSKVSRATFAVTWNWSTANTHLIEDNLPIISKELTHLWQEEIVENAYFDSESPVDKLAYFPNIAFFLKAHTEKEAKSILDDLTIVEKGIATYQVHPVGLLWLGRKTDFIYQNGVTKSFVTVWETQNEAQISPEILTAQSEKVLKLWNAGTIENVYFDIEGTQQANAKTDFVFFVNANTQSEAEAICTSLPFYSENIATYKIHQAGVFWMGKYENQ